MENRAALMASILAVIFLVTHPLIVIGDDHRARHVMRPTGDSRVDPLTEEMVKLDHVFREVVSGVAVSDGERVHQALASMHGAMEKTHEGVHEGTVKIPKNADRVREFVDLDKRFHAKLEKLAEAAHRNDGQTMTALTKELLDGCVQCHRLFRNP